MAQPFPRVSFTMPGDGQGVPDEDIIMISVDNDTKAPILTILNAATTNNGGRRSRLLYRPMPGTRCRSRRQGGHRLGTGRSLPERVLASLSGRLVSSIALAFRFAGCSRRALTAHRRKARRIHVSGTSPQPELIPAEEHARIRRPAATPAPTPPAADNTHPAIIHYALNIRSRLQSDRHDVPDGFDWYEQSHAPHSRTSQ